MQLGNALDLKGEYLGDARALASRVWPRSTSRSPSDPECGGDLAHARARLVSLGRAEEALAAFEKALGANPTDAAAHSGIGRVHFILRGEFAGAVAAYERALALDPRRRLGALQLAHCAALARDFAKAEAAARRAIVLQQAVRLRPHRDR